MRVFIDARLNIAKLYRILRLRPRALVNFEFFTRILYRIYGLTLIGVEYLVPRMTKKKILYFQWWIYLFARSE